MKIQTIIEIEELLRTITSEDDPALQTLLHDERKGVQKLIHKWRKQKAMEKQIHEKFLVMNSYEKKYRSQGYHYIAGVDEVGRGPLAGPVVAAAVILPNDFYLAGIDDSKKLSENKRLEFDEIIRKEAIAYSVARIDAEVIDQINIYEATKKAMLSAIVNLTRQPDFLLIDAMKLETPYPVESIIKGDAKSVSIAAASIVAKVARDKLMVEMASEFPVYGFQNNMGYGTKEHLTAIEKHGITRYHRKSFAPVKDMFK
ncbi:ribonuclease HII [Neobacillus sp. K501]